MSFAFLPDRGFFHFSLNTTETHAGRNFSDFLFSAKRGSGTFCNRLYAEHLARPVGAEFPRHVRIPFRAGKNQMKGADADPARVARANKSNTSFERE